MGRDKSKLIEEGNFIDYYILNRYIFDTEVRALGLSIIPEYKILRVW